jgi:antitoxin component of RelBE/YafQ-DinJ toxin-antitoxin module
MGKKRVASKAKEKTVMLDLDADVVEALEDIAHLAGVTPSQVLNVMLATKVRNEKKLGTISLGDK